MKNNKYQWKKIYACILAVCLSATLLMSHYIPGAFAEETTGATAASEEITDTATMGKKSIEKTTTERSTKVKKEETEQKNLKNITIKNKQENITITGMLPKDAKVTAKKLTKKQIAKLNLKDEKIIFAYDITIWVDGKEYEPTQSVKVNVADQKNVEKGLKVTHIETDKQGEIEKKQKIRSSVTKMGTVKFEADSFSYYVATLSANPTTETEEVNQLIDADVELLKWKAEDDNTAISVSFDGTTYNVSNNSEYNEVYKKLLDTMKEKGTIINTDIEEQTIEKDAIWNISSNKVSLKGTITVPEGKRLIIVGNEGTIQCANRNCGITSSGIVGLQGNVMMDGNANNERSLLNVSNGEAYLTDDFHIGNSELKGVIVNSGKFYMLGGLIGTKDITFTWNGENGNNSIKRSYEDTINYIKSESDKYDYIEKIESTNGCQSAGVYIQNGSFVMNGGLIAGNKGVGVYMSGNSGSFEMNDGEIVGNTSAGNGGGIYAGGKITLTGGHIWANRAASYCSGVDVCSEAIIKGNTDIAYNSVGNNGGGIGVESNAKCTLEDNVQIRHNTAIGKDSTNKAGSGNGGGLRVVGTLIMNGGTISYNFANGKNTDTTSTIANSGNGGGINGQSDGRIADIHLNGGVIANNKSSANGGGLYLTCLENSNTSTFAMRKTEIKNNISMYDGGGVYLSARSGQLVADIESGKLDGNKAIRNGGGFYLELGDFEQSRAKSVRANIGKTDSANTDLQVENNSAKDGGGLYITRTEDNDDLENNTIEVNLLSGILAKNNADNGAGIEITQGTFYMSGGELNENVANENGSGLYVGDGSVKVSGGVIKGNKSEQKGAGIYQKNGTMEVMAGTITSNKAEQDGGGVYISNGNLDISGGILNSNTATNGGGFYLAGGQLKISDGSITSNTATTGAGMYVSDSVVRMFGGEITSNKATNDGGGMYVSADQKAADVVIRSGKLTNNTAGNTSIQGNGGAIAVVSNNSNNQDHVTIGVREKHKDLSYTTRKFTKFEYTDDKDGNVEHWHESCPEITGNQSYGDGGGIYMNSQASILDIYCLLEENNTSQKDKTGGSIMSEGGKVNIGDIGDGQGNNTPDAVGNVFIQSSMLVKGGTVNLYGNTENPKFADKILVDIQENAGEFHDYRYTQLEGDINYKIEYFENFNDSGKFTSMQYKADAQIEAMGNMYEHEGYTILGWDPDKNAKTPKYKSGDLIGDKDHHEAWDGKKDNEALKLYAIWKKVSYTVEYKPNSDEYKGTMENKIFNYGETEPLSPNAYKVKGKHFVNWNTQADGNGTSYNADYSESKMSNIEGAKVTLYAQWENCTHVGGNSPGIVTYKANQENHTITESCDCEAHTATIKLSGADVYYDGEEHPATLQETGFWLEAKPQITYTYRQNNSDSYGEMPTGESNPKSVGYYKATITVGDQTISVEYQIKSQADSVTIEVAAKRGQHFADFNNTECTVAKDDAFTVQYQVQSLNNKAPDGKKVYKTAPVLTLSKQLPMGTTIIMQTKDGYWYQDDLTDTTTINLTSFKKMGEKNTSFVYYNNEVDKIADAQTYRFIIDFSKVEEENQINDATLQVGLKYAYTDPSTEQESSEQNKEEKTTITLKDKAVFTLTNSTNNIYTIQVPSDITDTRWQRKNLVWKIKPKDTTKKLPSDAKLTIVDSQQQTAIYSLNANGEFVIPFTWTGSSNFMFALSSEQESVDAGQYELTAVLCIGSKIDQASQPAAIEDQMQKASSDITLTFPQKTDPSLKITGNERVLSKSDNLEVNIQYKDIANGDSIKAIIQKKDTDGEYKGNYCEKTITQSGEQQFTLGSTDGSGSYRLWVTVCSSTGQTLLEVPYYFIVQ